MRAALVLVMLPWFGSLSSYREANQSKAVLNDRFYSCMKHLISSRMTCIEHVASPNV